MKKIFYILAILVSTFVWGQQKQVPLGGDFGGTRCNGSIGLCSVTHGSDNKNPQESKMVAEKINNTSFLLIVNRSKINAEEEFKIIGANLSGLEKGNSLEFIVEEDFILDQETLEAIGITSGYTTISKGKYPMSFDEEKVYIRFTLKNL